MSSQREYRGGSYFWSCAVSSLLSGIVSTSFSVLAVVASSADELSLYALSRSFALLIGIVVSIALRSASAMACLAITMSVMQSFDSVVGAIARSPAKIYGPMAFAAATGITAALLLSRAPTSNREW